MQLMVYRHHNESSVNHVKSSNVNTEGVATAFDKLTLGRNGGVNIN
jgi:hypothetical protein